MKIGGSGQSSVGSPQSAGGRRQELGAVSSPQSSVLSLQLAGGRGQEIGAVSSPQSSVLSLQLAGGRGQEIGVKGARDERGKEQGVPFAGRW